MHRNSPPSVKVDHSGVAARLGKIVFRLEWEEAGSRQITKQGTGFLIGPNGLALTAWHCLAPTVLGPDGKNSGEQIGKQIAYFPDRERIFTLEMPCKEDLAWQKELDVAVIRIEDPPSFHPVKCKYFEGGSSSVADWKGHAVTVVGYPIRNGSEQTPAAGWLSAEYPLRGDLLAFVLDPDERGEGLSGAPLFDHHHDGIVGLVRLQRAAYFAAQLSEIRRALGPEFGTILKPSRPEPPPPERSRQSIFRWIIVTVIFPLLLFLAWNKWQPVKPPDVTQVEVTRLDGNVAGQRGGRALFEDGERLRFNITPSVRGYLYAIDQELDSNMTPKGERKLLLPTLRAGYGRNFVDAGVKSTFPADPEMPAYFEPHSVDRNWGGDLITVLIFPKPLKPGLGPSVTEEEIPSSGSTSRQFLPRSIAHPSAPRDDALAVARIFLQVTRTRPAGPAR